MREEIPIAVVNTHLRACAQDRAIIDQAAMLADSIRRALIASYEVFAQPVIVHAISLAANSLYLRHGFTRLPVASPTLALDLINFQKLNAADRFCPKVLTCDLGFSSFILGKG